MKKPAWPAAAAQRRRAGLARTEEAVPVAVGERKGRTWEGAAISGAARRRGYGAVGG